MTFDPRPVKKWIVTRTETITVEARTEDHALYLGEQMLDFYDAETTDVQVEEQEV